MPNFSASLVQVPWEDYYFYFILFLMNTILLLSLLQGNKNSFLMQYCFYMVMGFYSKNFEYFSNFLQNKYENFWRERKLKPCFYVGETLIGGITSRNLYNAWMSWMPLQILNCHLSRLMTLILCTSWNYISLFFLVIAYNLTNFQAEYIFLYLGYLIFYYFHQFCPFMTNLDCQILIFSLIIMFENILKTIINCIDTNA